MRALVLSPAPVHHLEVNWTERSADSVSSTTQSARRRVESILRSRPGHPAESAAVCAAVHRDLNGFHSFTGLGLSRSRNRCSVASSHQNLRLAQGALPGSWLGHAV